MLLLKTGEVVLLNKFHPQICKKILHKIEPAFEANCWRVKCTGAQKRRLLETLERLEMTPTQADFLQVIPQIPKRFHTRFRYNVTPVTGSRYANRESGKSKSLRRSDQKRRRC